MVTTRNTKPSYEIFIAKFKDYLRIMGRDDIILVNKTNTYDSEGRVISQSETETTISGDLQSDQRLIRELVDLGQAKYGDGIFYCLGTENINPGDYIYVNNIYWKLSGRIEFEDLNKDQPYQGWVAGRTLRERIILEGDSFLLVGGDNFLLVGGDDLLLV